MKTNLKLSICVLFTIVFSIIHGNTAFGQCYASALSPSTINAPYGGGQYTVAVTTGGCTTYNISNYTNFATYSKNGLMVTVTVQANSGSARSGNMLIGNRPLTINQACGNFPSPPTSASSNPSSVCYNAGGTISLSASGGSGTDVWWGTTSGGTNIGSGNPKSVAAPTSTTTYYAHWENSCGSSSSVSVTVTVNALPTPSANNNGPICAGSTLQLYSSGGDQYSWTGPNGFSSGAVNPYITSATTAASGTYTVTVTNNSTGCSAQASTNVTVRSNPTHTASSNSPVCVGSTINLASNFGSTYAWTGPNNYSASGQYQTITNATTANAGDYTVIITDTYGCWSQATTNVVVNTLPSAGASSNSPVCYGNSINLTGSGGSSYSWTGPNGFTSNQQNPSISNVTTLNGGLYSVTVSNGNCSAGTSTYVTVRDVLSGGQIAGDQTICYFTDAANITSTSGASGGSNSYTYAWQYSINGGSSWSDAGGSSTTFDPSTLTTTTQYRRKVTDASCGVTYSNTVTKTVRTPLDGGLISPDQSICYNADPAIINSITGTSGGSGAYSYAWEKSINGGSTWTDAGGTSLSFDPSNLIVTTQYHRKATDNNYGCTGYSNMRSVTVGSQLTSGVIAVDETICYGADAGNITSSSPASGGSGAYTYSWEYSENGGTSWLGAGSGAVTFDPGNLLTSTLYHRNVTDNNCLFSVVSNNTTKTVRVATFPGSISGDQTVFYNTTPSQLNNATLPSGGTGSFSYQWQQSVNDGSTWNNISGAVSNSHNPSAITIKTKYQRNAIDNGNSCIFSSNAVSVDVTVFASPDTARNYIYTREPNTAVTDLSDLDSPSGYRSSIQYFDGLGRPDQITQVLASPSYSDLITPIYYDSFGREPVRYLPFSKPDNIGAYADDAITQQSQFYNTAGYFPGDTANAKTVFENSPLNRILEQGAPGRYWQPFTASDSSGHTLKYEYGTNSNYDVLLWRIQGNSLVNTGGVASGGYHYYPANTLFKTITKDENWKDLSSGDSLLHTTQECKDLQGNVILKRTFVKNGANVDKIETYYIYDDFGLLRYVLPPKAVANISDTSYTFSDNIIRGLCYYYRYDARRRMVLKQLPGADSVFMIYDKRDRLVLTQDGNRRDNNEWMFTKYDRLNRPVLNGILTYGSSISRDSMQTIVDNVYSGGSPRDFFIDRDSTITTTLGFTTGSFPGSSDGTLEYLSASYYDNYDFPEVKSFDSTGDISDYTDSTGNTEYLDQVTGLLTGTKTKVIGTNDYINATNYYDNRYRIIQSRKNLYDDAGGNEIISNNFDFTGKVTRNRQKQYFDDDSTLVDKYYTYDHIGRLLKAESEVNDSNRVTVAEMTYNELGQMTKKGLNKIGASFLQEADYAYSIRGWLRSINDPENLGSDIFSMKLMYEDPSSLTNLTKEIQYNGNISAVIWNRKKNQNDTLISAYTFRYDALNRLTNNYYGEGASLNNSDKFREYDYSYDRNGNIQALKRNNGSGNVIDNLSYTYLSSLSNQPGSVSDASTTAGFNNGNSSGDDYSYDNNGNLEKDLNKGFGTIEYNYLNLPKTITKDGTHSITYYYDALGTKLKQVTVDGGNTSSKYYLEGFEYNSDKSLNLIHMDEGVINRDSSGAFAYDYFIKDHLGNTRVTFENNSGTPLITQLVDYYPFGLQFVPVNMSGSNKYLYNGKELQDESLGGVNLDWYDFQARFYDPQIGRWTTMDPLAEERNWVTPYNFVQNNPLVRVDPDGQSDEWVQKEDKSIYWDKNATSQETTKAGETYLGKAVVAFEGSKNEKLGEDGTLTGDGAISANVTVFGPKGKDDVQQYRGLTVSSDPDKYPMLAEGQYTANYSPMAKSLYGDNERTKERGIPGALTYSLSQNGNTNLPVEGGLNKSTGFSFMTEAFIHRTDWNGKATNSSQGCLVIDGRQYGRFENQLGKAMSISVSLIRK